MKNAFLVSDEDLRSLRTEPWFIELNGPAVFLHESVLKLIQQASLVTTVHSLHTNGPTAGRSLLCDQPTCPRSLPGQEFPTYSARQTHRAMSHGIAGASRRDGKKNLPPSARDKLKQLPSPMATIGTQVAINRYKPASYNYGAFDAKGICGIGECDYKPTGKNKVRALHFHRSVKHGIRGINWNRKSHIEARTKRKVGRPKKVAV